MLKLLLCSFWLVFCNGLLDTNKDFDRENNKLNVEKNNKSSEKSAEQLSQSLESKDFTGGKELETPRGPEGRNLKNLSPGQEYLLSVVTLEDVKNSQFENLPHLSKFLQHGSLDFDTNDETDNTEKPVIPTNIDTTRYDSNIRHSIPSRLFDMMAAFTKLEKADDTQTTDGKPSGLLASFTADPMNFILNAIIPLSLLLAAVVPVLTNLLMTGMYTPSVYSIVTGNRGRSLKDANSTEHFLPILESIASFGVKTFEDITKENADETKVRFVKETLDMITSFVSKNWLSLFSGASKLDDNCFQGNCTSSAGGQ